MQRSNASQSSLFRLFDMPPASSIFSYITVPFLSEYPSNLCSHSVCPTVAVQMLEQHWKRSHRKNSTVLAAQDTKELKQHCTEERDTSDYVVLLNFLSNALIKR